MKHRITHPSSLLSRGFTLIELVLVLTILALLMGAAITMLNRGGLVAGAQEDRIKGDLQTLSTALDAYSYGAGRHPSTEQGLEALVEKPTAAPVPCSTLRTPGDRAPRAGSK